MLQRSLAALILALLIGSPLGPGAAAQTLEFLQPTNGAVFSTRDEIPIVLRASAPGDVFFSADVFANIHHKIGTAVYCCPICLCVRPETGEPTLLQIPATFNNSQLPGRMWQGWTNVSAMQYQLTARAAGENGTVLTATPVTITVIDRELHIGRGPDGTVVISIRMGSMVPGGYDLEISSDLRSWTRLGEFSPGNVAAFYWDHPPADATVRFYRAVYVPPKVIQP